MLDVLPLELIDAIVRPFCGHCCQSDARIGDGEPTSAFTLPRNQEDLYTRSASTASQRRPLLALCLTSKRLCNAMQPILYHEFMPGWGETVVKFTKYSGIFPSFARTLAHRRDLASAVRRLYIDHEVIGTTQPHDALDALRVVHATTGLTIPNDWNEDIYAPTSTFFIRGPARADFSYLVAGQKSFNQHDVRDALLHILFLLLPNIRHVQFAGSQDCLFESIPSALRHASDVVAAPSLKSLKFNVPYPNLGAFAPGLEIARDLINATKSIESLTISRCLTGWLLDPHPSLTHIKSLQLDKCWLETRELSSLTDACRDLESFAYTAAGKHEDFVTFDDVADGHFDGSDAVTALKAHSRTLERLHLNLEGCRNYSDPDAHPLTSLAGFTALESLSINLEVLYHCDREATDTALIDIMPSGIKNIRISSAVRRNTEVLIETLNTLLSAFHQQRFPHLRCVGCKANEALIRSEIDKRFIEAGIDFEWDGLTPYLQGVLSSQLDDSPSIDYRPALNL
ncbi:hypothetical protein F5Y18DRAFT_424393 [Xylariaceae sp. FL1019]|nr:hypothetical protein F5Y18DRAFT_424393 [Xylariaceae sp. FL1019]